MPTRKKRKDALPAWVRQQRRDHARARWRAKHRAAGRCDRCGRGEPTHPPTCNDCRDKHRTYQQACYRRRMLRLKREGLPTKKLERSLDLLATRLAWSLADFAAARWPEDPAHPRKAGLTRVHGVAAKALRSMERRRLAECQGGLYSITQHGRDVLANDVPRAAKVA